MFVFFFIYQKVPKVGSIITHESEAAKSIAASTEQPLMRDLIYKKEDEHKGLSVILVADSQGSLEAIINALPEGIKVVGKKSGEVTDADIILAKSTGSILLSFNTKLKPAIVNMARSEKILLRNYEIIYELLEEIKDAQEGKLMSQMEQVFGTAKILQKFPFEKTFAFGVSVQEGRMARGDRVRVMRGAEAIGETTVASLRIGKDQTSKVESGKEAGLVFGHPLDIRVGDVILSHS